MVCDKYTLIIPLGEEFQICVSYRDHQAELMTEVGTDGTVDPGGAALWFPMTSSG